MKKEYIQKIMIPEGVEVEVDGDVLKVNGKEGKSSREFKTDRLTMEKKGNEIIIGNKNASKKEKKMINTTKAHVTNMIKGVQKKFEYRLKVCYNHFPFTVEVKGKEAIIKNFLGEKTPRRAHIPGNVEVKIEKDIITIKSHDKELAGQTAANFETATKIRLRDRRVFQDGIFIIEKNGRQI